MIQNLQKKTILNLFLCMPKQSMSLAKSLRLKRKLKNYYKKKDPNIDVLRAFDVPTPRIGQPIVKQKKLFLENIRFQKHYMPILSFFLTEFRKSTTSRRCDHLAASDLCGVECPSGDFKALRASAKRKDTLQRCADKIIGGRAQKYLEYRKLLINQGGLRFVRFEKAEEAQGIVNLGEAPASSWQRFIVNPRKARLVIGSALRSTYSQSGHLLSEKSHRSVTTSSFYPKVLRKDTPSRDLASLALRLRTTSAPRIAGYAKYEGASCDSCLDLNSIFASAQRLAIYINKASSRRRSRVSAPSQVACYSVRSEQHLKKNSKTGGSVDDLSRNRGNCSINPPSGSLAKGHLGSAKTVLCVGRKTCFNAMRPISGRATLDKFSYNNLKGLKTSASIRMDSTMVQLHVRWLLATYYSCKRSSSWPSAKLLQYGHSAHRRYALFEDLLSAISGPDPMLSMLSSHCVIQSFMKMNASRFVRFEKAEEARGELVTYKAQALRPSRPLPPKAHLYHIETQLFQQSCPTGSLAEQARSLGLDQHTMIGPSYTYIIPIKYSISGYSALFLADEIVQLIQQNRPFRQIWDKMIENIHRLKHIKIKGLRISCAGRTSKKAAKAKIISEKFGRTSLHVFSAEIDFALKTANTRFGTIGVKVWLAWERSSSRAKRFPYA
eukprot:evm.model.scf_8.5 EVM.evm.TU.scf_8.5   scf_8:224744-226735(-)